MSNQKAAAFADALLSGMIHSAIQVGRVNLLIETARAQGREVTTAELDSVAQSRHAAMDDLNDAVARAKNG